MRATKPCRNCGHTSFSIDRYTSSGDVSCSRCGTVQEENPIVSEVQFGESSSGAAVVQGTMVGADQTRATFGGRQNAMESREQTLQNGRKKIKRIATAMRIPDYISDAAAEWFRLALTLNFVQGRRSQNVLAACLYVACRKEKTPHMLIDFSSRLQISVYSLGATFLKMVRALHITNLPLADPSLFIQHFAERLDFGDLLTKVIKDAVKLAQRMANDWIHEGRRPAGVAGACVLLAARMNNFRRSHAEIVAVAHVAEETLQRRLNEFKKTSSGALSVADFRSSEQTDPANPPSFNKNREQELRIAQELQQAQTTDTLLGGGGTGSAKEAHKQKLLKTILKDCDLSEQEISNQLQRIVQAQQKNLQSSMYTTPSDRQGDTSIDRVDLDKPRNLSKNLPRTEDILQTVSSHPTDFSDLDDEELSMFKLTEEEHRLKERVWTGLNHDFLLAQERKRLKEEADELTGNTSGSKRKRKPKVSGIEDLNEMGMDEALANIGVDDSTGEPLTAADSAKRMLSKKSFSKKINYATLGDLFGETARAGST
ncbi:Transcription factor IIIB 70 kDa subunit [Meyerozyma sp. JA9]|nr:Transcription factor IIIB 70 kDa subunit [Meyerozyma sp. JA9]